MKITVVLSILLVLVLNLAGCSTQNEFSLTDKPKDLLSEEKFTSVLSDILLLESTAQNNSQDLEHVHKIIEISSPVIFKKHHVSKKKYTESFEYYAQDKEKMEEIYTKILDDYNIKLSKLK
jgi:rubrerythrin